MSGPAVRRRPTAPAHLPEQPANGSRVQVGADRKHLIEQPEEPTERQVQQLSQQIAVGLRRLQQNGRQGRAQCQRIDGRNHRRGGDRDGELAEEFAL